MASGNYTFCVLVFVILYQTLGTNLEQFSREMQRGCLFGAIVIELSIFSSPFQN